MAFLRLSVPADGGAPAHYVRAGASPGEERTIGLFPGLPAGAEAEGILLTTTGAYTASAGARGFIEIGGDRTTTVSEGGSSTTVEDGDVVWDVGGTLDVTAVAGKATVRSRDGSVRATATGTDKSKVSHKGEWVVTMTDSIYAKVSWGFSGTFVDGVRLNLHFAQVFNLFLVLSVSVKAASIGFKGIAFTQLYAKASFGLIFSLKLYAVESRFLGITDHKKSYLYVKKYGLGMKDTQIDVNQKLKDGTLSSADVKNVLSYVKQSGNASTISGVSSEFP